VKVPKRFVSPSTSIIGSDMEINQENRKVDQLVPKPMARAHDNALGTTRSTQRFLLS
jgi:hypothetical protein